MKRWRRIEITTVRQRTTIVLGEKLDEKRITPLEHIEAIKEPVAGNSSDPIGNSTIEKRRDDYEDKN